MLCQNLVDFKTIADCKRRGNLLYVVDDVVYVFVRLDPFIVKTKKMMGVLIL